MTAQDVQSLVDREIARQAAQDNCHCEEPDTTLITDTLALQYPCLADPATLSDADARWYARAVASLTVAAELRKQSLALVRRYAGKSSQKQGERTDSYDVRGGLSALQATATGKETEATGYINRIACVAASAGGSTASDFPPLFAVVGGARTCNRCGCECMDCKCGQPLRVEDL
jgi:hypothetical protein